ncbi:methylmalonic aciduria and homocystinuria type D homolog, mitochondrial-like isoform X2 [Pseudomyrmex gracilis]|uniref:methylmalonic aciduria and homocystinuria type D homolog, mitochondrial-like isoform X2 n=1 Tax=Pseudomyrmex gracilis TaxID=219809 RepID=UPI000995B80C|nr:methylmalonic aciduria and homocystinuria type D homolog, mitochondrial-like isoform X2 [Pseudomyrmex gracilis]
MFCTKYGRRHCTSSLFDVLSKVVCSRRVNRSTSSYKVIETNGDLDDIDNSVLSNSNWELLTPRGFRFYLPGRVGLAWLDAATTAQVKTQFVELAGEQEFIDALNDKTQYQKDAGYWNELRPMMNCVVQECPILLRKSIRELFPGCLDGIASSNLTIITLNQKANLKVMRWHKEAETEKLAKCFVLAASEICSKLKMIGYWADFINPFSGQPYMNPRKGNLYETDERFRCVGFKIEQRNNCRIIVSDNNLNNFIGSLYTTAPANTEFLKQLIHIDNED